MPKYDEGFGKMGRRVSEHWTLVCLVCRCPCLCPFCWACSCPCPCPCCLSLPRTTADTARQVFNTHFLWDMLPKWKPTDGGGSKKAKYIYVVREGQDVITSFFHHLSNQVGGSVCTRPPIHHSYCEL